MFSLPHALAMMLVLPAVLAQQILGGPGDAYDHRKNSYITDGIKWLEVGFFNILPDQWTTITPLYTNWSDPVVFLSLPNLAGNTATEGTSMSLRVNNSRLTYISHDFKNFSFDAKSVNANDSYCTTWKLYTPSSLILQPSYIGWMVVEKGKYNVSHKGFIISTDRINRTNVNDSDKINQFKSLSVPLGACDGNKVCRFELKTADVLDNLLMIGQLQTTRFDRFLLMRGISRGKRFVVFVLVPHDSDSPENFHIPWPGEDYAWMLFQTGLDVTCVENLVIETYVRNVTYIRTDLTYSNTFLQAPAVFGMIQTLRGRDSVGLRAFNIGESGSSFITQEDKCSDGETIHETREEAALLIIGRTTQGTTVCGAQFENLLTDSPTAAPSISLTPTASPTAAPSAVPSASPTAAPTASPTAAPTAVPTASPTAAPTASPTAAPSAVPSASPTAAPTASPSTAAPSASPSAAPSAVPTAVPSAAPSSPPTNAPTASPSTRAPSAAPSAVPSGAPSVSPTAKPTASPTTAAPSVSPTLKPTAAPSTPAPTNDYDWCTRVTLYDTFGDGWGKDVALRVWSDNGTFADTYLYYLCPNDFAKGDANGTMYEYSGSGPFEFCSTRDDDEIHFDIVVLDGPVKETWEMYWTVEHFQADGNGTSQIFVGDFDTNMTASMETVDVDHPVDYFDQTCKRCKHPPKPPAKGKSASKSGPKGSASKGSSEGSVSIESNYTTASNSSSEDSYSLTDSNSTVSYDEDDEESEMAPKPKPKPHWPFPITLFDTNGNGWFNASEAWTAVPLYNAADHVEWHDYRRLPETLAGPEYVIETIDRLHDVRRNTICGDLLKEDCEERLPDAKYIFRVTGALSKWDTRNNTFWHFCGKHGTIMEELEFKLVKGKCFPGRRITAHEKCYGTRTASFDGMLIIQGAGEQLSEYDTAVLEADLAEALSTVMPNLHGFVSIETWQSTGFELIVRFTVNVNPAMYNLDGLNDKEMQNLASQMSSAASSYVTNGLFMKFLRTSLSDLPLELDDALSTASSVQIEEITFVGTEMRFGGHAKVETATLADAGMVVPATSVLQTFSRSVMLAGIAVCAVVIVVYSTFAGARQLSGARYRGAELLPTESEREKANTAIDVSEREVIPNWN